MLLLSRMKVLLKEKRLNLDRGIVSTSRRLKMTKGIAQKAKCIYCSAKFGTHSKIHGTSSIRNHMLACKKNPHNKDSRHALLTFKLDVEAFENVGLFGA